jgi:hypothetical protein
MSFAESLRQQARSAQLNASHKAEQQGVIAMANWIRTIRTQCVSHQFLTDCASKGKMKEIFKYTDAHNSIPFLNGSVCADGIARWAPGEYYIYILGKVCEVLREERVTSLVELIGSRTSLTVTTNWTHRYSDCYEGGTPIQWATDTKPIQAPITPPEPFIIISWEEPKSSIAAFSPLLCFNEFSTISHL